MYFDEQIEDLMEQKKWHEKMTGEISAKITVYRQREVMWRQAAKIEDRERREVSGAWTYSETAAGMTNDEVMRIMWVKVE